MSEFRLYGDGVTDDAPALQAIANALAANPRAAEGIDHQIVPGLYRIEGGRILRVSETHGPSNARSEEGK